MQVKLRVLLHVCSNIVEDPETIVGANNRFGSFTLGPSEGNYREIKNFVVNLDALQPDHLLGAVSGISFQDIANQLTTDFGCPDVYVHFPKITPRGIFVTYSRNDTEKNMLFLKIVFEGI